MNRNARSQLWRRPRTRLGWWAVGLSAAYLVMYILNTAVLMRLAEDVSWRQTALPFYGISMMLCGLVAGVVGLLAVIRSRERSWIVWLALLLGASVVSFVLGELLFPH
jgi:ABC-type thiamin/hydroxymethylpyrimidine transport system permease subunit